MTIKEMQERMLGILAGYYGKDHVFYASQKMPRFPTPYINIKFYKHRKTSSPICRFDEQEECYKNYWTSHMDADINLYTKGENINKKEPAVYKDTSMEDLEDFVLYLASDEIVDALAREGLTVETADVTGLGGLVNDNSAFNYRAMTTIGISFTESAYGKYNQLGIGKIPNASGGGSEGLLEASDTMESVNITGGFIHE